LSDLLRDILIIAACVASWIIAVLIVLILMFVPGCYKNHQRPTEPGELTPVSVPTVDGTVVIGIGAR